MKQRQVHYSQVIEIIKPKSALALQLVEMLCLLPEVFADDSDVAVGQDGQNQSQIALYPRAIRSSVAAEAIRRSIERKLKGGSNIAQSLPSCTRDRSCSSKELQEPLKKILELPSM